MVDGVIKGSKGVDIAAGPLDLLSDFSDATRGRAFEEHMFIDMRDTSLGILLIDAPNFDPHIQGDDRRTMVRLQEYRQTIIQHHTPWLCRRATWAADPPYRSRLRGVE
jgi:hypothetical protein